MPDMYTITNLLEDMDATALMGDMARVFPDCHTTVDAVLLVEVAVSLLRRRGGARVNVDHMNRYMASLNL